MLAAQTKPVQEVLALLMICVLKYMLMGTETRYVPEGMYTIAFLVVAPLQFSPQRFPSSIAR